MATALATYVWYNSLLSTLPRASSDCMIAANELPYMLRDRIWIHPPHTPQRSVQD